MGARDGKPRTPGALFRDRRGRIRSGWRVGAWLAGVIGAWTAASWAGLGALPRPAAVLLLAGLVGVVSLLAWRVLDGRSPRETWLWPGRAARRDAAIGLAFGVALVGVALLPVVWTGDYAVEVLDCRLADQAGFVAGTGLLLLGAAVFEEAVFRGYPLYALRTGPGRVVAVIVTSALFSLLHAGNPHFGAVPAAALFGIGAVLAVSVLQRRSVAEALGAHLGWNLGLGVLAALPVSGVALPAPCHAGVLTGSPTWTGGGFGLEASVPAAAAWALAALLLWIRARREPGR